MWNKTDKNWWWVSKLYHYASVYPSRIPVKWAVAENGYVIETGSENTVDDAMRVAESKLDELVSYGVSNE